MLRPFFVSSTFRDMHYERDIIQTKVVPAVNAVAAEYGESIAASDLRWGIDTTDMSEESSAKKVLNVCLDEIDRCRPYMIVILGDRYGWIPDHQALRDAVAQKERFLPDAADLSVTALEIAYGALSELGDIGKILFYFREIEGTRDAAYLAEDEDHRAKLRQLKARIKATPGSHVRTYSMNYGGRFSECINDFAAMVTKDICDLMRSEWEENAGLDEYDLDQKKHMDFLREKSGQFIARGALLERSLRFCREQKGLILTGPSGSGKSTLISRLGHELQAAGQQLVPIYCGYTRLCGSGFDLLRYIVWALEKQLGIDMHFRDTAGEKYSDPTAWYDYYGLLVERHNETAQKELTILIDGIDQLIRDDIANMHTYLPSRPCGHIRFVLSTTSSGEDPFGYQRVEVGELSAAERGQVIRSVLPAYQELPQALVDEIVSRENAGMPLYLSLMIQRLRMMNYKDYSAISQAGDGMDAITRRQLALIRGCPPDLAALSVHIITQASRMIGGEAMLEATKLIAVSRGGLCLSDLEGILKNRNYQFSTVDAVTYIRYLGSMFIYRSDGRVDFAHKSIRTGFLDRCGAEEIRRLDAQTANWLCALPPHDEVRKQEMVFHLIRADQKRGFVSAIGEMFHARLNTNGIAKDIADAVISDEGAWFIDTVKECFLDGSFPQLSSMMTLQVFFNIVDTAKNIQIKQKVCEILLEAAQKRCVVCETHGNLWEITVACDRLAQIHLLYKTKEHRALALKYAQHSLRIRRTLLERYRALDTPEKRRTYFETEMQQMGLAASERPADSQLEQLVTTMRYEIRRGICVSYEDIADILQKEGDPAREQVLAYLSESLELRLDLYRNKEYPSYMVAVGNEANELSQLYGKIADIHMSYGDDRHWMTAKEKLEQSLEMAERSLRESEDPANLTTWCSANVRMAELYMQKKDKHALDRALSYYLACVPVLEKADIQYRTTDTQRNLADIYNRLGNFYSCLDDEESRAAAQRYYQKSRELVLALARKRPGLDDISNVLIVTQNQFNHDMKNGSSRNESTERMEQMATAISVAYQNAKKALQQVGSNQACEELNEVFDTVIRLVGAAGLDAPVCERLRIELEACQYENRLNTKRISRDTICEVIIRYAEFASQLEKMPALDPKSLDSSLMRVFKEIEFPLGNLQDSPKKRAYELLGTAYRLSKFLVSESKSLENLDIYAVTLSKYCGICMEFSMEEWKELNGELLSVAHFLHRQTKKEKYMQMLAMGEMGRMILGMSKESAGDSEESRLKSRIAALEEELKQLTGLRNLGRRRQVKKQLEQLQQELSKL